MMIMSLVWF